MKYATKIIYILIFTAIFFPVSGFVQGTEVKINGKALDETAQKPAKRPVRDAGLSAIGRQTIEAHLSFLASDALEGREAGKNGGRVASEYIKAVLLEYGVKPFYDTYFQRFEAYSPAREKGIDFQVHPDSIARYKQLPAYRRLNLQNVVGCIEGEQKDEYIIIGAHYDHVGVDDLLVGDQIYNGADDNAASVAALLQIAQSFAASGGKPLKNIVLAFWDGEEINYLGSEYFVENFGDPSRIKAYINLDMISREGLMPVLYPQFEIPGATAENTAVGNQFHLAYTGELDDLSKEIGRAIADHHLDIVPKPAVMEHGSRGSDYLAFSLRHVPILWFFTGLHPDYHTPGDETGTVHLEKLTDITKAVYLSLQQLANEK
ncbi:MAG: M20/M25/M40 family metallo-hydrolase [Bacteroidales bacterium]|jgi:Zn-dependent M28 family amino/carboxypeptidase|nr:M20/M25/M40 family metallo-hydrolase [Bacteroidales bacterium]